MDERPRRWTALRRAAKVAAVITTIFGIVTLPLTVWSTAEFAAQKSWLWIRLSTRTRDWLIAAKDSGFFSSPWIPAALVLLGVGVLLWMFRLDRRDRRADRSEQESKPSEQEPTDTGEKSSAATQPQSFVGIKIGNDSFDMKVNENTIIAPQPSISSGDRVSASEILRNRLVSIPLGAPIALSRADLEALQAACASMASELTAFLYHRKQLEATIPHPPQVTELEHKTLRVYFAEETCSIYVERFLLDVLLLTRSCSALGYPDDELVDLAQGRLTETRQLDQIAERLLRISEKIEDDLGR